MSVVDVEKMFENDVKNVDFEPCNEVTGTSILSV